MWPLLIILACSPASRRITAPPVQVQPRSEVPAPARTAYLDATIRREQGDLVGAVTSLARARAFDPDSPWLRLEQAEIAVAVGDLASADVLLSEVELSHPDIAALWRLKGQVQLRRADGAGARASAARGLALAPADPELRRLDLSAARQVGPSALTEAVAAWRAVPLVTPEALGARGLGLLPYDPSAALDDLGPAFALGSSDEAVVTGLVQAGLSSSRLLTATRWLERRPDAEGLAVARARARLGAAAEDAELRLRGLRTIYAQAVAEDPAGTNALKALAEIVLVRYRLGEAPASLRAPAAVIYARRADLDVWSVFYVQVAAGQLDKATTLLAERRRQGVPYELLEAKLARLKGARTGPLLSLDLQPPIDVKGTPPDYTLYSMRLQQVAVLELESGQPSEAIGWAKDALRWSEEPSFRRQVLVTLARAYDTDGQGDLALATWEAVLREWPTDPGALLAMARRISRTAAGPARALPMVEDALEGGPCVPEAWALYAELLEATGSRVEAEYAREQSARFGAWRRFP